MVVMRGKPPGQTQPSRGKMLFFGKPGTWKTRAALQFPRPYLIDAEGGADQPQYQEQLKKQQGWYFGPSDGASDPNVILEVVRDLTTTKHEFRTVVVDSVSKVCDTLRAREAARLGDKNAFGADKKPAVAWMRQLVTSCEKLDTTVILIAHEVGEWSAAEAGGERQETGKTGDVYWQKVPHELNLSLRFIRHNKGLIRCFVDKSRLVGFQLGETFEIQKNGDDVAFEEFSKRMPAGSLELEAKPLVFATADQVREILRLQELVKMPEADVQKWWNAAKVDRWDDLTTEQADKAIAAFKALVAGKETK